MLVRFFLSLYAFHFLCLLAFGWQVTVCILAGIALSCVGFGALYKPLTASKTSDEKEKEPLRPVDVEMVNSLIRCLVYKSPSLYVCTFGLGFRRLYDVEE